MWNVWCENAPTGPYEQGMGTRASLLFAPGIGLVQSFGVKVETLPMCMLQTASCGRCECIFH